MARKYCWVKKQILKGNQKNEKDKEVRKEYVEPI